jgi:hypothetical protein
MKIAIVGRFKKWDWGQFPDESYLADGLEKAGVSVARVEQERPYLPVGEIDWVLFSPWRESIRWLEPWRRRAKTILWTLDWLPDFRDRAYAIQTAYKATLFVTSDEYEWKKLYGIENHRYLSAACEGFEPPFNPAPTIPCAFIGSLYNERRQKIAALVKSLGGEVKGDSSLWREDLAAYVQRVKVVIGDNYRNDIKGYWSSRNYVIPGAGGFLLTPKVPGLERHFEFDQHLSVYNSVDELKERLPYWIEADAEREKVRAEGFRHVRVWHSWDQRAKGLLEYLREDICP